MLHQIKIQQAQVGGGQDRVCTEIEQGGGEKNKVAHGGWVLGDQGQNFREGGSLRSYPIQLKETMV